MLNAEGCQAKSFSPLLLTSAHRSRIVALTFSRQALLGAAFGRDEPAGILG